MHYIQSNSRNKLIRSDSSQNKQSFKSRECLLNWLRHFLILRLLRIINLFPFISVLRYTCHELSKLFNQRKPINLTPTFGTDPFTIFRFFRQKFIQSHTTRQQEPKLFRRYLTLKLGQPSGKEERQQKLILLE